MFFNMELIDNQGGVRKPLLDQFDAGFLHVSTKAGHVIFQGFSVFLEQFFQGLLALPFATPEQFPLYKSYTLVLYTLLFLGESSLIPMHKIDHRSRCFNP